MMDYEEKRTVTYRFEYANLNDNSDIGFPSTVRESKAVTFDDSASWPTVLREFMNFLSGVYGYDVADKVFMKDVFDEKDSYYRIADHGC